MPLPVGMHRSPVEQVVVGDLAGSGLQQWLLPGVNGSIHVLAADGKALDHWETGAIVCGVATVTIDGQPAIVIASPEGIEASRVKPR